MKREPVAIVGIILLVMLVAGCVWSVPQPAVIREPRPAPLPLRIGVYHSPDLRGFTYRHHLTDTTWVLGKPSVPLAIALKRLPVLRDEMAKLLSSDEPEEFRAARIRAFAVKLNRTGALGAARRIAEREHDRDDRCRDPHSRTDALTGASGRSPPSTR